MFRLLVVSLLCSCSHQDMITRQHASDRYDLAWERGHVEGLKDCKRGSKRVKQGQTKKTGNTWNLTSDNSSSPNIVNNKGAVKIQAFDRKFANDWAPLDEAIDEAAEEADAATKLVERSDCKVLCDLSITDDGSVYLNFNCPVEKKSYKSAVGGYDVELILTPRSE